MVDVTQSLASGIWQRVRPHLRWTRSSTLLLGTFLLTCFLIVGIWWNLAAEVIAFIPWGGAWWLYMDWLLLGIFGFMSLLLVVGADIRKDALIIFVGMFGGLVIESWGTQTNLWTYYTLERPPLWIIPAWPVASLAIDRLYRLLRRMAGPAEHQNPKWATAERWLYGLTFGALYVLMLAFLWPT